MDFESEKHHERINRRGKARQKEEDKQEGGQRNIRTSNQRRKSIVNLEQKKAPNINCRVETFVRVISTFDKTKRHLVEEMGFKDLLHIHLPRLPRTFAYWVMTRFSPREPALKIRDDILVHLTPNHVAWVLGTPLYGRSVPTKIKGNTMRAKIDSLKEHYGYNKGISMKNIIDRVMERGREGEVNVEVFKHSFVMMLLGLLLCPTTCFKLSVDLLLAVTIASKAAKYDWSSLVLEKLVESGRRFENKLNKDENVKGAGGCTLFLLIFYLDRLRRTLVKWGIKPCLRAWTQSDLKSAIKADMSDDGYFSAAQVVDVAYGHQHPLEPRDVLFTSGMDEMKRMKKVCKPFRTLDKGWAELRKRGGEAPS